MTFAIAVLFEIKAEGWDRFVDMIRRNAATSVAEEAGCLRFDVLASGEQREVCLYEIYEDRAAFDGHLASAHFKDFDASSTALVVSKKILTGVLFEHAKAVPAASTG
jgi:quinol monooxygenase YgiN